jgi:IS5 family transposase
MIISNRKQSSLFISVDSLVQNDHPYRKLDQLLDFSYLGRQYANLYSHLGRQEKGAEFALRCLVLQFLEDVSDREMARYLHENIAAKWFCNLNFGDEAPHHSYFGDFRKRLGTKGVMDLFSQVRQCLKSEGLVREVFTFVDASHLISKLTTWDERDKAIKQGMEAFNNQNAKKVAVDKQARFGNKGKSKFWYGYKRHASVDMQSGLINKIAATPGNVTDAQGLEHICPNQGAVYGDKGYCTNPATATIKRKSCHNATIKRNNMKGKDKAKDRWISGIRSPYERVFSSTDHRVRYKGLAKTQFQVGIQALVFNLKRLLKLGVLRLNIQLA